MFDFDNGAPPSDGFEYTLMSWFSYVYSYVGLSWYAPYTLSIGSCLDILFMFLFSNPTYKDGARLVVSLQWNAISHFTEFTILAPLNDSEGCLRATFANATKKKWTNAVANWSKSIISETVMHLLEDISEDDSGQSMQEGRDQAQSELPVAFW